MNLKGSKTEENLKAAFAGESQALNKYSYYAERAREDGHKEIANIFEETSRNEREHAKLWFKFLHEDAIPATEENLKDAVAGEHFESTDMYVRMAKEAKEEGFDKIAFLFDSVGKIEATHEERYNELLKMLSSGTSFTEEVQGNKDFKKAGANKWQCTTCGFSYEGKEPLDSCPVCQAQKAHMQVMSQNFRLWHTYNS